MNDAIGLNGLNGVSSVDNVSVDGVSGVNGISGVHESGVGDAYGAYGKYTGSSRGWSNCNRHHDTHDNIIKSRSALAQGSCNL